MSKKNEKILDATIKRIELQLDELKRLKRMGARIRYFEVEYYHEIESEKFDENVHIKEGFGKRR